MEKTEKDQIVTRTVSMRMGESELIDMVNDRSRFGNASMAFRHILHEWEDLVLKAGRSSVSYIHDTAV